MWILLLILKDLSHRCKVWYVLGLCDLVVGGYRGDFCKKFPEASSMYNEDPMPTAQLRSRVTKQLW